jgi:prolyl-tRNA editing enzyme YbaK/EbsC (Cys-tRNA(Pro) deacylase)
VGFSRDRPPKPGRDAAQHDRSQRGATIHPTAERLQARLRELGLDAEIRELADSTRTAQEAADAVGVEVGQIVKSLLFVAGATPLLCLCAGDRRVDTGKLGPEVRQAKGNEVREATGFAIGGVPPLGHDRPLPTVVDSSLRRFEIVWCAGGTPHAVFPVAVEDLIAAIPDATVREIS